VVIAWLGLPGAASADLAGCRTALLTTLDPVAALTQCNDAVTTNPSDPQARLLRALARLASLPFQPTVDALADAFGLSDDGRFPPDAGLLLPTGQLAPGSPAPSAAQAVVTSDVLPALDAALADLAAIGTPFTIALTADEMASFGVTSLAVVEVDESDAELLAAVLQAARFALLVGVSYDLDFDVDDAVLRFSDTLDIQAEIMATHPALLGLRAGAAAQMAAAKLALCAAVDSYDLGILAIAAEADAQGDDLVALGDPQLAAQVSQELARLRAALDAPQRVLAGPVEWKAEFRAVLNDALGTAFDASGATLDLRAPFDAPASLRPLAPTFGFDPLRHPPSVITGYPDPTFAGALTAAPPAGGSSPNPCPPAVPEPAGAASALAALLAVAGLGAARRRTRSLHEPA